MKSPSIGAVTRRKIAVKKGMKTRKKNTLYYPNVSNLKKNFDEEFGKFLRSLKMMTDHIEANKTEKLLPLEKKLRGFHRKSQQLQLQFKSMLYWKTFFVQFIERCDDIIKLFRFDDLRDVDESIKSANLHPSLAPFVKDNLKNWRQMFENKKWMIEYRENVEELNKLNIELEEEDERFELIVKIMNQLDKYAIDVEEIENVKNENKMETIRRQIEKKKQEIMAENKAKEAEIQLKQLPETSMRSKTREWCMKHYYEDVSPLTGSSDDEPSSSTSKSSIFGEDGDHVSDLSSSDDVNEMIVENDNFDSFFSAAGL